MELSSRFERPHGIRRLVHKKDEQTYGNARRCHRGPEDTPEVAFESQHQTNGGERAGESAYCIQALAKAVTRPSHLLWG